MDDKEHEYCECVDCTLQDAEPYYDYEEYVALDEIEYEMDNDIDFFDC